MIETEIKLRIKGTEDLEKILNYLSSAHSAVRTYEDDTLFDTRPHTLTERREMLRLRISRKVSQNKNEIGNETYIVTHKGAPLDDPLFKRKKETEFEISDPEAFRHVLSRLGYHPVFRYQKYRTEFKFTNLIVALDETPIGFFIEIEGDAAEVRPFATELGFNESEYLKDTYYDLWHQHCLQNNLSKRDMIFHEGNDPGRR